MFPSLQEPKKVLSWSPHIIPDWLAMVDRLQSEMETRGGAVKLNSLLDYIIVVVLFNVIFSLLEIAFFYCSVLGNKQYSK